MENSAKKIVLVTILLLALGGAAWWLLLNDRAPTPEENDEVTEDTGEIDTSAWRTYENSAFGFAIDYPSDWEVAEFPEDEVAPTFNFIAPGQDPVFPVTHHSDVAHVSVYPHGIPTEGIFGDSRESALSFDVPVKNVRDFILEDGSVWATFAGVSSAPMAWSDAGFLFARVSVENLETGCLRDGALVSEEQCDPIFGDVIVRRGDINEKMRAVEAAMLESFHFLEGAQDVGLRVDAPEKDALVSSPLMVSGEAVGTWYFEASFPVRLFDANGNEVAVQPAQAQGEWMTTDYVPFEVTLTFNTPSTDAGVLVLQKDNPSGLPQFAGEVRIPVRFR